MLFHSYVESNENKLTNKTERDSQTENRLKAVRREGVLQAWMKKVKGLSQKKKKTKTKKP